MTLRASWARMPCATKRAFGPAHALGLRAITLSHADPQNPTILICTPSLSASARAAWNSDTTPPPLLAIVQTREVQPKSLCSAGLAPAGSAARVNATTGRTIRMVWIHAQGSESFVDPGRQLRLWLSGAAASIPSIAAPWFDDCLEGNFPSSRIQREEVVMVLQRIVVVSALIL